MGRITAQLSIAIPHHTRELKVHWPTKFSSKAANTVIGLKVELGKLPTRYPVGERVKRVIDQASPTANIATKRLGSNSDN